jgi:hypothetical protein
MKLSPKAGILLLFFSVLLTLSSCSKKTGVVAGGGTTPPPVIPPPVVVVPPTDGVAPITPAGYTGYNLVWNDEFNSSSLDTTKWNYEVGTGVNGDFGTGQLDRATKRTDNVNIQNNLPNTDGGGLAIATRAETYMDRNYTSGRINTQGKASFGPGDRIEARIWARDVRYKGQGFAFWLMPDEYPAAQGSIMWPQGGEVDVMEYVGSVPSHNLGSVHYAWFWNNNEYADWNHAHKGAYYSYADKEVPAVAPIPGNSPASATDLNTGSGGYYIYRIEFFNDRLEFSINNHIYHIHYLNDGAAFNNGNADGQDQDSVKTLSGKRVYKSEYSNHFPEWHPFEHKFYMIFSAGVGGNDNMSYGGAIVPNAIFPCAAFIDWIRVYKRK